METDLFMLLDSNSRNILSILSIISEKNEWYTIHDISNHLNVVERTIQRYILQLNDSINEFNDQVKEKDRLFLRYEKYKGVHLETPKGQGLRLFKHLVLEQDETFMMLKHIFFEEFESVTKYALDHYISESKVRKSLKKIRQYLKRYQLSLSNISFKITGEEKNIRLLTYYVMWYGFKTNDWPFKQLSQEKLYKMVDYSNDKLGINVTKTQRKQLTYMLGVNLFRLSKGHVIHYETDWEKYVNIHQVQSLLPELVMLFFRRQQELSSEIYFYMLLIQLKANMYQSERFKDSMLSYHQQQQSDVYCVTEHFVKSFHKNLLNIPQSLYDSFFLTSFCSHLFCKVFQCVSIIMSTKANTFERQTSDTRLHKELNILIENMLVETNNTIFMQKQFLVEKYMMLFSMIHPITYFEPTITILLESDLPFLTKKLLEKELTSRYSGRYHIECVDFYQEGIDLILTNISESFTAKESESFYIYYFEYPLSQRDIEEIDKLMENIHKI